MSRIPLEERLIVALDAPTLGCAEDWLQQLKGVVRYYKIGLELFTAHGWKAVNLVKNFGGRVFLDLKLHDIPNTVSRTMAAVCEHEVDMVNVHALGGFEMMREAREAIEKYSVGHVRKPKLVAVTVLTSHDQGTLTKELGISRSVKAEVLKLAAFSKKAGLDGIVCSPQETSWVRGKFRKDFIIVTPGIRPAGTEKGDQKRIYPPAKAVEAGSDYIVVGRPITQAVDLRGAATQILNEMSAAIRK